MEFNKLITPQLTQTEIDEITAPTSGEVIFNTTTGELVFFNGSIWQSVVDAGGTSDDKLFRINATDSVSGYHEDKIIDSNTIIWTTEGATNKTRKAEINEDADYEFNGTVIFNGAVCIGGAITINLTQNEDDLSITGLGAGLLIRVNATGNYSITGIVPASIFKGQWIVLTNVSNNILRLKNNDAASVASNRFLLGQNTTIRTEESIALIYDTVDQRWRPFATTT
jgi:hypothetical protein